MLYAQKGNKVNRILEHETEKYLANGFMILDENGAILDAPVPTDLPTLQSFYKENVEIVKSLKADIKALTDENKSLKDALESAKTTKSRKSKADDKVDEQSEQQ